MKIGEDVAVVAIGVPYLRSNRCGSAFAEGFGVRPQRAVKADGLAIWMQHAAFEPQARRHNTRARMTAEPIPEVDTRDAKLSLIGIDQQRL